MDVDGEAVERNLHGAEHHSGGTGRRHAHIGCCCVSGRSALRGTKHGFDKLSERDLSCAGLEKSDVLGENCRYGYGEQL